MHLFSIFAAMKFAPLWFVFFLSFGLSAQQICRTDEVMQSILSEYPETRPAQERYESLLDSLPLLEANASREVQYTIPVVVHIIYRTASQNISDAQVHSQIDALNRDFNRMNSDFDKVPEVFQPIARGANIRFQLADRDPNGFWTKGITRSETSVENIGDTELYFSSSQGGKSPWPRANYLNIWVCELDGQTLGFATLPGANMTSKDGIVMSFRAFGQMGSAQAPYNLGRTCVHEVGHYLGLKHLWDNDEDCDTDDGMSDTPVQFGPNYGCPSFPSPSCDNGENGDMFMNYMDYIDDPCALMFTERQTTFMRLVLTTMRGSLRKSTAITGTEAAEAHAFVVTKRENATLELTRAPIGEPIELIDLLGKIIYSARVERAVQTIEVRNAKGVYLLRVGNVTQKVIL